ncbi:hypothetical protein BBJ28_00020148 [Nothophytophthora sp. Chile5]|nr:hypothetical protein BBJ28_00020148 [Nothophytophthora sp. Chile5]
MHDDGSIHLNAAFALNALAALATVLGGSVICSNRLLQVASPKVLATVLSISGGVTLFLSLVLLFSFSVLKFSLAFTTEIATDYDIVDGQSWLATTGFFTTGVVVVYAVGFAVKKLTPESEEEVVLSIDRRSSVVESGADFCVIKGENTLNIDDAMLDSSNGSWQSDSSGEGRLFSLDEAAKEKLQSMGIPSGIAIMLHNIPSGIATFTAGAEHPDVGLAMAIGVGLLNLAEGVAVAAPVYFATANKWKGIMWCVVAVISQHIGGLIAFAVIGTKMHTFSQASLYGVVAGMMAAIAMKEIFPTAYMYANGRVHFVSNGGLFGMMLMAVSLVFFKYLGV